MASCKMASLPAVPFAVRRRGERRPLYWRNEAAMCAVPDLGGSVLLLRLPLLVNL
ncbi:hypothetical protein SAMN05216299_11764 [Nitrosospira sp. Nsp14]|nr:hypothetical protein SAMN05216299_11764 [Nitrosospira sp. Nsp14]